jgi:hypothetical protein
LVLLKAFSDRARDFDDLAVICAHKGSSLDNDYIDEWAKLDALKSGLAGVAACSAAGHVISGPRMSRILTMGLRSPADLAGTEGSVVAY